MSKQQINAGRRAVDVSVRAMASAFVLLCHAWLHSIALPPSTRQQIEDLPIGGTNETSAEIKKENQTARSFGLTQALPALVKHRFG